MARFKLTRNSDAEDKELFQVKLPKSLVAEINLMVTWAKRDRTDVVREMLRYALAQEADFQRFKKSTATGEGATSHDAPAKKEPSVQRPLAPAVAAAR